MNATYNRFMNDFMDQLPTYFWDIPYDGACYPGSTDHRDFRLGANCQVFAYALLSHFGYKLPAFRSSDLWEDTQHTQLCTNCQPLDLLLFNKNRDAYGAHVGVYVGNNRAIHLCAEVGKPALWTLDDFAMCARYATLIGGKRVILDNTQPW